MSEPAGAEAVDGGRWEDGKFIAPDGWPEGAGWVVRNADGSIDQWGPARRPAAPGVHSGGQSPAAAKLWPIWVWRSLASLPGTRAAK